MKNLHLEHLEDLIFEYGDVWLPFNLLEAVFNWTLGKAGLIISTKWDGAPAFVAGIHPELNRFFVGTKSAFSNKFALEPSHIPLFYESPGLQEKLAWLYRTLKPVITEDVVQGDMLWWPGHRKLYPDTSTVAVQPNTLKYSFAVTSAIGNRVLNHPVGVVIHTLYTGKTLADLSAEINYRRYQDDTGVAIIDPLISTAEPLMDGETMMTIWNDLKQLGDKYVYGVRQPDVLDRFKSGRLNTLVKQFINHAIRIDMDLTHLGFKNYIFSEYSKEAVRLKTEKGKARKMEDAYLLLKSLDDTDLDWIFAYFNAFSEIKNRLIAIMDTSLQGEIEITLPPSGDLSGQVVGPEGYVVKRTYKEQAYFKLVNRKIFSRANMLNGAKDWVNK